VQDSCASETHCMRFSEDPVSSMKQLEDLRFGAFTTIQEIRMAL
jgi:hypothetical protein